MKKNIWIMNHYAGGMFFDKGGRHYWFAKYLSKAGYKPVVFCANSKHGSKPECFFDNTSLWHEHMAEEINTPFVFIRTRPYVGNGKTRVLNFFDFYFNLRKTAKEYVKLHGKPDVIYASSAHPLTTIAGIQLAKYFGVKCICEVRDLWPESIVAYGLLKRESLLAKILYQGEKWIYKKADALIFTMEGGAQYIIDKGWDWLHGGPIDMDKVHHINNGVDLEQFDYNKEHYKVIDRDLEDSSIKRVTYTGSLRKANGIDILLDAAKLVRNSSILIQIWGAGDEASALADRIKNEGIKNVMMMGKVSKNMVPGIISKSYINFVDAFDDSVAKYGISSNKLFEYYAAGKPVLVSRSKSSSYVIASDMECNMYYRPDAKGIAEAIECVCNMSKEQYDKMCLDANIVAQRYSFKELTKKLIEVLYKEGEGKLE